MHVRGAPAWLAWFIILLTSGAASGQAELEDTRVFGAWSLEVSQHTQQVVAFLDMVNEGLAIASRVEAGDFDHAEADAQLRDWSGRVEQQLADYAARAEALALGPAATPPSLAGAAESMAAMPLRSSHTAQNYYAIVETYVRDVMEGRNPDPTLATVAQFSVFQAFYEGLSQTNRQAAGTVAANHPQHHLLQAMAANTDAAILVFELARQSLGAEPSRYAPDDIRAELQRLNQASAGALGEATMAHRMLSSQINALTPAQMGLSPQAREALIAMMATYPDSIQAESDGAALMLEGPEKADPAGRPAVWQTYLEQLGAYEERRDALQVERQRLASQL